MKTIVFQGDSITDARRSREEDHFRGSGYVTMTAGKVGMDFPGKYHIFNRGVSGDRIVDVYARMKADILNLKPDILTMLIGVNDTWHAYGLDNGVPVAKYEKIFNLLVQEIRDELPQCKIVILEPFVLPGCSTAEIFDEFFADIALRQQVCRRLCEKYHLPLVPLQKPLEELAAQCSNDDVLFDGVHPTFAGHECISRELYKVLQPML